MEVADSRNSLNEVQYSQGEHWPWTKVLFLMAQIKRPEYLFNDLRILNETYHLHGPLALGAGKRVYLINLLNQSARINLAQFFLYSLVDPPGSRIQGIHLSWLTGLRTSGESALRTLEEKQQILSVSKDTGLNSNSPILQVIFSDVHFWRRTELPEDCPLKNRVYSSGVYFS